MHASVSLRFEHDLWAGAFAQERQVLAAAFGLGCEFAHIGSTAVATLPARPIVDIAVAVPSLARLYPMLKLLRQRGYEFWGDRAVPGEFVFFRAGLAGAPAYQLYVSCAGHHRWESHLRLRQLLRQDAELRALYGDLKRAWAEQFADAAAPYEREKSEWLAFALVEAQQLAVA